MDFHFAKMNKGYAEEIAKWRYDGIYAFYDMDQDREDLGELLDPANWENRYFAALNENRELAGYFIYEFPDGIMRIGLGLKPQLTGKGLGKEFVLQGIGFGVKHFSYKNDSIDLLVAAFNKRAIKVYEKIGFTRIKNFIQETNEGQYEFIRMMKKASPIYHPDE